MNPSRTSYDTDLTEAEWAQREPLVPPVKPAGRPPKHSRREILNAIFSGTRRGEAWHLRPHDLPAWRTVYHYFWLWDRQGIWQTIHDQLHRSDRQGARPLLVGLATQLRRLRRLWAEGAYVGELETWTRGLRKWGKLRLEIIRKPKGQNGFVVLPWRWRVERTLAGLCRNRRLPCDYERLPQTTEALIYVARIGLMTRRLAAS